MFEELSSKNAQRSSSLSADFKKLSDVFWTRLLRGVAGSSGAVPPSLIHSKTSGVLLP